MHVLERPTLDLMWEHFMSWLRKQNYSMEQPILLCAFNGFDFDFKILLHHLKSYSIELPKTWYLIDPFFDRKTDYGYRQNFNAQC